MTTIWFNYLEDKKNCGKYFGYAMCLSIGSTKFGLYEYIFRCSKYFHLDKHVGVVFVDIVIEAAGHSLLKILI